MVYQISLFVDFIENIVTPIDNIQSVDMSNARTKKKIVRKQQMLRLYSAVLTILIHLLERRTV